MKEVRGADQGPRDASSDQATVRWALWRLDDNGNRFLMACFADRGRAEAAARAYAGRGHKQMYYVEPA